MSTAYGFACSLSFPRVMQRWMSLGLLLFCCLLPARDSSQVAAPDHYSLSALSSGPHLVDGPVFDADGPDQNSSELERPVDKGRFLDGDRAERIDLSNAEDRTAYQTVNASPD